MKPAPECALCLLRWFYDKAAVGLQREQKFKLFREISKVLVENFYPNTNLGRASNTIIEQVAEFISVAAPEYKDIKAKSNKLVKDVLSRASNFVMQSKTDEERFLKAVWLATLGNVAPLAKLKKAMTFEDALNVMEGKGPLPHVIGDIFSCVQTSQRILYISDNAGEIGFDSLLISELKQMGAKVTLAVKAKPLFEDATLEDAEFFLLHNLADEVLGIKGFFVPDAMGNRIDRALKESDLVMVKGTGNYEAVEGELKGKALIYMLKVTCGPVAHSTGTKAGEFVARLDAPT